MPAHLNPNVSIHGKLVSSFSKNIPFMTNLKPSVNSDEDWAKISELEQTSNEPVTATHFQHYEVLRDVTERAFQFFSFLDLVIIQLTQAHMLELPKFLLDPRVFIVTAVSDLQHSRLLIDKKMLWIVLDVRRDLFERHTNEFSLSLVNCEAPAEVLLDLIQMAIPADLLFFNNKRI